MSGQGTLLHTAVLGGSSEQLLQPPYSSIHYDYLQHVLQLQNTQTS